MTWQPGKLGWRLLPGTATALVVALLFKLNAWYPLEQLSYQALFRLRGPTAWDARVVVVTIDDASLKALGRFPWSRQRYAQLLKGRHLSHLVIGRTHGGEGTNREGYVPVEYLV